MLDNPKNQNKDNKYPIIEYSQYRVTAKCDMYPIKNSTGSAMFLCDTPGFYTHDHPIQRDIAKKVNEYNNKAFVDIQKVIQENNIKGFLIVVNPSDFTGRNDAAIIKIMHRLSLIFEEENIQEINSSIYLIVKQSNGSIQPLIDLASIIEAFRNNLLYTSIYKDQTKKLTLLFENFIKEKYKNEIEYTWKHIDRKKVLILPKISTQSKPNILAVKKLNSIDEIDTICMNMFKKKQNLPINFNDNNKQYKSDATLNTKNTNKKKPSDSEIRRGGTGGNSHQAREVQSSPINIQKNNKDNTQNIDETNNNEIKHFLPQIKHLKLLSITILLSILSIILYKKTKKNLLKSISSNPLAQTYEEKH